MLVTYKIESLLMINGYLNGWLVNRIFAPKLKLVVYGKEEKPKRQVVVWIHLSKKQKLFSLKSGTRNSKGH